MSLGRSAVAGRGGGGGETGRAMGMLPPPPPPPPPPVLLYRWPKPEAGPMPTEVPVGAGMEEKAFCSSVKSGRSCGVQSTLF